MSNFFKALKNKPPAPVAQKVEYRLYYNKETGRALFYSMSNDDGDYVVIDKETYVRGKMNIQVVDGKLHETVYSVVYKLVPNVQTGTPCYEYDVSIVDPGSKIVWGNKVKTEIFKG